MKRLFKVCIYVVLMIFLAMTLIGLLKKVNVGSLVNTFYVLHDGKKYSDEENDVIVNADEIERFDVKYTLFNTDTDYSVRVVPNVKKEFTYRLGSEEKKYSNLNDTTFDKYFCLKKYSTYFTIVFSSSLTFIDLLQDYYDETDMVTMIDDVDIQKDLYFTLLVVSNDEQIRINFGIQKEIFVEYITLDKSNIII